MSRKVDDLELASRMKAAGMGGFVLKTHHSTTYGRATLVSKVISGIHAFGGISLNNSIGGLNPQAVDTAGRMGAKIIWMPTVDSDNEKDNFLKKDNPKLPYWAVIQRELHEKGMLKPFISAFDEDGNLKREVEEILDLISQYNMVLATGHLKPSDGIKLIKKAKERHVKNIVVTHPEFPTTFYTLEEQKDLSSFGVYFERCYTTPATGKVEWDYVIKEIVETGPNRNVLSTDLGQPQALYPDEGYKKFIEFLLSRNVSEDWIAKMASENARRLLSVE